MKILQYSPVSDLSVLNTSTIVSVDDGPLRTNPIFADPALLLML